MFSIATSFIASMTVLPALILIRRPRFVTNPPSAGQNGLRVGFSVLLAALLVFLLMPRAASAESLSGEEVVARVNAVDDGQSVTRRLEMAMVDRRGKERRRETLVYRKDYGDEIRTLFFYLAPANVRDTGFLIWDYADEGQEDDQWLYLPAMRKVRRISAADRGDYFLGTDFTYEDIKLDGKLEPEDYEFSLLGEVERGEQVLYHLAGRARSDEIADELGYSRIECLVDITNWMVVRVDFWDLKEKPLKTLEVSDIVQVDGIWTRRHLAMSNHQTGHRTLFVFTDVDYVTPVEDDLFTKRALERGR
jgi:hypothetical protein